MTDALRPRVVGSPFGTTPDGDAVDMYRLTNASEMEVRVISYGGIIVSITAPDRRGTFADVTLGYSSLDDYVGDTSFVGALIGRYANRIAHGCFALDGELVALERNDGDHHLHGGDRGFHRRVWNVAPVDDPEAAGIVLRLTSPAGDEGYPGRLDVRVTYVLTDENDFIIDYHAVTDAPTPVNLTQHAYFNLAGHDAGDVLGHDLLLAASSFTPVGPGSIPTGEIRPVAGTPFDFTTPRRFGAQINVSEDQLLRCGGYDHNFVLDSSTGTAPARAARLIDPVSGRVLEIWTTEPGLQVYSANYMRADAAGKRGARYGARCAVALEPQHFPDSPNKPAFPSTILRADGAYVSRTVYSFRTDAEQS